MYIYIYIVSNGKQKPRQFPLIRLPFVHRANFVVSPFVDKETNGSYPFANGLNGLVNLC